MMRLDDRLPPPVDQNVPGVAPAPATDAAVKRLSGALVALKADIQRDLVGGSPSTNAGTAIGATPSAESAAALEQLAQTLKAAGISEGVVRQFAGSLEALLGDSMVMELGGGLASVKEDNTRLVALFGVGDASSKCVGTASERRASLGGKGAALGEMSGLGLAIPPGFTIKTEACQHVLAKADWPDGLHDEVQQGLAAVEAHLGKKLGDPDRPLLVSVRSGAQVSMPGMMDTVLNLGLNDAVCEGLSRATNDPRFAYDTYRRFVSMFGNVVLGVESHHFEEAMAAAKASRGVKLDTELDAEALKELVATFKATCEAHTKKPFPEDPQEQLQLAINAVFSSWECHRAVTYRRLNNLTGLTGTAVNVQAMVFGNLGNTSGTGVCFTRNPSTGANELYGEFMVNAQGEDVVAGIRTPMPISSLKESMPEVYDELVASCARLEKHYGDMQDIEFTVENGRLFTLQSRDGKRSGDAALTIAVDMATKGLVEPRDAILERLTVDHIEQAMRPRFSKGEGNVTITHGVAASPGAAVGRVAFTVEDAIKLAQSGPVILVRNDTSPEDIGGMDAAVGILTHTGGKTSHAAVVARGWGKPCITGCEHLLIDEKNKVFYAPKGVVVHQGDWISLDGSTGEVVLGKRELIVPESSSQLLQVLRWADEMRGARVRIVAESVDCVKRAASSKADGVGLFKTEHMFSTGEKLAYTQAFLLGRDAVARGDALFELEEAWVSELRDVFHAAKEMPVTFRLLAVELAAFIPEHRGLFKTLAQDLGVPFEKAKERSRRLARGERQEDRDALLALQTRTIVRAALKAREDKVAVAPLEILIPGATTAEELDALKSLVTKAAKEEAGDQPLELRIGATVETPQAAMNGAELARQVDFLSYDSDALTRHAYAVLPARAKALAAQGLLKKDPFKALDVVSVGKLCSSAREAREANPSVSIRMSGTHLAEASAATYALTDVGVDMLSTSARSLPQMKLLAAKVKPNEMRPALAETGAAPAPDTTRGRPHALRMRPSGIMYSVPKDPLSLKYTGASHNAYTGASYLGYAALGGVPPLVGLAVGNHELFQHKPEDVLLKDSADEK